MSRYELPGKKPRTTIAVGWDAPLQTFFMQVFRPGRRTASVWKGGSPDDRLPDRAERAYVSARASMDAANTLMSVTPPPRPKPVTESWRTAGARYDRARARAERIWGRCKRHAIEAAAGIAS